MSKLQTDLLESIDKIIPVTEQFLDLCYSYKKVLKAADNVPEAGVALTMIPMATAVLNYRVFLNDSPFGKLIDKEELWTKVAEYCDNDVIATMDKIDADVKKRMVEKGIDTEDIPWDDIANALDEEGEEGNSQE